MWSPEDRQLLLQIQQQGLLKQQQQQQQSGNLLAPAAAAAGGANALTCQQQQQQSEMPSELGELLPPLVCSAGRRLRLLAGLLRSVWGALIPPVLAPCVGVDYSSSGAVAQQRAMVEAPW